METTKRVIYENKISRSEVEEMIIDHIKRKYLDLGIDLTNNTIQINLGSNHEGFVVFETNQLLQLPQKGDKV